MNKGEARLLVWWWFNSGKAIQPPAAQPLSRPSRVKGARREKIKRFFKSNFGRKNKLAASPETVELRSPVVGTLVPVVTGSVPNVESTAVGTDQYSLLKQIRQRWMKGEDRSSVISRGQPGLPQVPQSILYLHDMMPGASTTEISNSEAYWNDNIG